MDEQEPAISDTKYAAQHSGPMTFFSALNSAGASLEQIEKMIDLQLRWEANEARKEFIEAMAKFRVKCPPIGRTRKGHNGKYSGLSETIETIKDILGECDLSHQWTTEQTENNIKVTCTVTHRKGYSQSTSLSAGPDNSGSKNSIQAIGSTISYLERYTLFAILGLASQDMDDDGNAAGTAPVKKITEQQSADLLAMIQEIDPSPERLNRWLKMMNLESVADLPASKFASAVKALEKARKAVK